jgi:hypothetical protein
MTDTSTPAILAVIARADAVRDIAAHLADRTAFVVFTGPDLMSAVAARLDPVEGWTGYADNGMPVVLRARSSEAFVAAEVMKALAGMPMVAVFIVPKSVPAKVPSEALGQEIEADGSRDIIAIHGDDGRVIWPMLFVDALDLVDPVAASQLRAQMTMSG